MLWSPVMFVALAFRYLATDVKNMSKVKLNNLFQATAALVRVS